jgi:KaiC/GvpD/RAD55 family RecA-like ATPase
MKECMAADHNFREAQLRIQLCRENYSKTLDLSDLGLERIPEEAADIKNLNSINASENNLTNFPGFIFSHPELEHLDLSYNRLASLPEAIGELGCLETLNLRRNELRELPEAIGKLAVLSSLDLGYNRLAALPESVNGLARLERCNIQGNTFKTLPERIVRIAKPKQLTLFGHMEKIIELSGKSGLSESFFKSAKEHIGYIACKLRITQIQAVLFSHIVSEYEDSPVSLDEIARSLCWNKIKLMQHAADFTELENRKLIRSHKDVNGYWRNRGRTVYRIPQEVIAALMRDEEYRHPDQTNSTIEELFARLEELFEQCVGHQAISYDELTMETKSLLNDNRSLPFVKKIKEYNLFDDELMLFLRFCHYYVNIDEDEMDVKKLAAMFDRDSRFTSHKRRLKDGDHRLITKGLIEYSNSDGFGDRESFKLTDTAKNNLLSELRIKPSLNTKDIIRAGSINAKNLFYNPEEAEQIGRLASLLRVESFREIQKRLSESGMRTGFACLFSGPPGTGKSETAYQIARETGRDIMMVDISQTKSMWFGESEKKIKELFTRYRNYAEAVEVTPILLFNEADAVIGKRKAASSSAVAQTENAIQNIILQEMENLKGILIATTNLAQNMDKAFERRFLYKIEFKNPGLAVRQSIWQSMLSGLSDADARTLASRFDFSGGQIENVSRKRTVDFVLSGVEPSLEKLAAFCREELLGMEQTGKIGFAS